MEGGKEGILHFEISNILEDEGRTRERKKMVAEEEKTVQKGIMTINMTGEGNGTFHLVSILPCWGSGYT